MYLHAKKYVSGYEWNNQSEEDAANLKAYRMLIDLCGMANIASKDSPGATVSVTVAYWRKANAIHQWFVENTADGKDECQPSYVSTDDLRTLVDLAREAIVAYKAGDRKKAGDLLTPTSGFFFGSTEVDEGYLGDLESTVAQLEPLLTVEGVDFEYQASW